MNRKDIFSCMNLILVFLSVYYTFDSPKLIGSILVVIAMFLITYLGNSFPILAGYFLAGAGMELVVLGYYLLNRNLTEFIMFSIFLFCGALCITLEHTGKKVLLIMEVTPVWILFILFCYVPLYFTKYHGEGKQRILGILYLLLYLAKVATENMENFKSLHKRLERYPSAQLAKVYFFSVISVLTFVCVGMFWGRNERIAYYMTQKMYELLNLLSGDMQIRLYSDMGRMAMREITNQNDAYMAELAQRQTMNQAYEGGPWFGYFLKILLGVIAFVVVLGIIYGIYCYLKQEKKDNGDTIEFIKVAEEMEDVCHKEKRAPKKFKKIHNMNEQIRRKYRKTIRNHTKEKIPLWASPEEIERIANLEMTLENLQLHQLYEKARYSQYGVTEEENKQQFSPRLNGYENKGLLDKGICKQ